MVSFSSHALCLPDTPLSLAVHPTRPLLAAGLTAGGVVVHPFSLSSPKAPCAITHAFRDGCHALSFVPGDEERVRVLAGLGDGPVHMYDATSAAPVLAIDMPVSDESNAGASFLHCVDSNVAIVGDYMGGLHIVDFRAGRAPVLSVLEHGDYVSGIVPVNEYGSKAVLVSSSDGTLCSYDMRVPPHPRLRLQYVSEAFDDELLSLAVLSNRPVAVAGTSSGALNIYDLKFLDSGADPDAEAHIDRFYGHPECVSSVLAYGDEGLVLTASSDGIVRVIDVPNKSLLGVLEYDRERTVVFDEEEKSAPVELAADRKKSKVNQEWPVECMVTVSGMNTPWLALIGHDNYIRFCDASALVDEDSSENDEDNEKGREIGAADLEGDAAGVRGSNASKRNEVAANTDKADATGTTGPPEQNQRSRGKRKRNDFKAEQAAAQSRQFFDDV